MQKKSIQAVLFDLDGTLIDTEPAAELAIQECFRNWGLRIDPDDAQFITGRTWETAFQFLFKKYPIPVTPETGAKVMIEKYRESLKRNLVLVPGSVAAV